MTLILYPRIIKQLVEEYMFGHERIDDANHYKREITTEILFGQSCRYRSSTVCR